MLKTSTFGAKFTVLKKTVEDYVILQYHLISMCIKVYKPTPVFVENISVVLNATNTGITLNKKTVALRYHFLSGHVSNNVLEVRNTYTSTKIADPFNKLLVSNYFRGFYHK